MYLGYEEKKTHTNQNLPVHRALKFSAVLGTTSARNSITTRPAGLPLMVISKYTLGLDLYIVDWIWEMSDGATREKCV